MKVKTWDGNNINDGSNYDSFITLPGYGLPTIRAALAKRHGKWPLLGSVDRPGRLVYVDIEIVNFTSTYEKQLYQWFDPEDETPKQLVVEDDGGGNDRYWECICESLEADNRFHYVAVLRIHGDVRLRESTDATDSWNITATGQTKALTNNGQDDAYPVLEITPTSNKTGGYAYKRWIPVRWRVDEATYNYPVDICNDSFDTAALISAKMQADGDDLRVEVDGVEVDRWLDGINTSTTKVWVNLNFSASQEKTLSDAIAGSGSVDTIDVDESINKFPKSGILMIDSEAFTYTGRNKSLRRFTGVTRAAKGTSMAAHTAGATVWWGQHDIYILYGNSTVSAPSVDDDKKPAFNLATSTNTSWDYDDFGDYYGLRTGAWFQTVVTGDPEFYNGNRGAASPDPWVEIGILTEDEPERGIWQVVNPCGITNVNFANGEKYAQYASFWSFAHVGSGETGLSWNTEYTIPAPSSDATWESWSYSAAITSGSTRVALISDDSYITDNYVECADVTLTLNSSYTPTITIGSEQGNYSLECTITNNTTGDAISLSFTMELNEDLQLDSYEKTVIYLADNSSQFQALTLEGGPRRDWLKLQPGSNTLQFDDTGTNGVTIAFNWAERHYL